jgi:hypothetical protein
VVNFTPWPLYSLGKSPQFTLDRKLDGPQNQSERFGWDNICFWLDSNSNPSATQFIANCCTCCAVLDPCIYVLCKPKISLVFGGLITFLFIAETYACLIEHWNGQCQPVLLTTCLTLSLLEGNTECSLSS